MQYDLQKKQLIKMLRSEGIVNQAVLKAIIQVPRQLFIPESLQAHSYENRALPIACQQTISQPFIVARMTEALLGKNKKLHHVLEIGTGSGYQAAVLSQLADEVYTIERIKTLFEQAKVLLQKQGYNNIYFRYGDGYLGWPEQGPYDGIIVTAAALNVPDQLTAQLAVGGRLVIPVADGSGAQILQVIQRHAKGYESHYLDQVIFVPLLSGTV